MAELTTEVVVQIEGEDVLAGQLWSHRRRGIESATFAYATSYLALPGAYPLDPQLPLVDGQLQTPVGRSLFGAFTDCAPDRWGRRLFERRERHDGGGRRSYGEIDYLLAVRDDLRQGALRFGDAATGRYLADEAAGIPDLIGLPQLLSAAERLEREEDDEEDVEALLNGGSSLGGARPKAHVVDGRGRVAIAKFPSPVDDRWDVMRWEAVALALARDAGVSVADYELRVVAGKAVLIVDRFDRTGDRRIGYVSAMTMLEATDGDAQHSYLDIAEVIEDNSPTAGEDLRELWRRIALSILISNTDDHLRNHGFLRTSSAGWALSPAFDINSDPGPGVKHLRTAIDQGATEARIDTLLGVAGYFRLDETDARAVLGEVVAATGRWRATAREKGLGAQEIERMAPAFEHEQAGAAKEIAQA